MATTRQSYSRSVAGHIGGLQGPVCVPASVQDAAKGRHSGRRAPRPLGIGNGSCLFVLPARATVKVKGLPHASSSRGAQHSCRQYSYRVLHTGQSLVYCRAARRSSTRDESASVSDRTPRNSRTCRNALSTVRVTDPSTGRRFSACARRGLTAHQAARFLQLQRLQAARHQLPASVGSEFDDSDEAAAAAASQDAPVDSHPISVPSSGRPSSNGSRETIRAVQGLPGLPPRSGAGSRASSRRSSDSGQPRSQAQTDFLIMQELLRRDYAVGYIMLGWLLRCTWALTPGIALLLKLPEPAMARSARQQLPALLAWLLFGGGSKAHNSSSSSSQHQQAEQQQALLQQLSPVALKGLQEQLVGPTAALASIASFSKTYQLLANAPVTAQQLVDFMHKQEQLLNKFPGLDLTANLQQGSSAAAVSAVLGDTHTNASAAAAAVAAMGDALSATAATDGAAHSTSNAAAAVPSVVGTAAREEAVSALASAVLESATSAVDPAFAGLSSLLTQLAKQAGSALQHLVTEQGAGSTQQQQQREEGGLSPAALLAQLQALQQRLPGQHDVAGLLADYQAWLEQLRGRLLKQHEHTQVHLLSLQTQPVATRSDLQQSEAFAAHIQEQQQLMESAKQQALQRYEQAKEAVLAVQQQLAVIADLAPEAQQQPGQQGQGASADQPAERASSKEQQMAAAVSSLNEDLEDVSADADRTSGELSTVLSVLTGQLQRIEQQTPPTAASLGPLDSAEVGRLSADAVGDVWWHAGAGSSSNAAGAVAVPMSAAVWSPLDAAEVARLSADAVGDSWPAGSQTVAAAVGTEPVQQAGAAAEAPQPAAVTATALLQQQQLPAQPIQGMTVAELAAAHAPETVAGTTQPQQPRQEFSPLQKLLVIDAAFVEPQWRKFVAAAGLRDSGVQAATMAAQGMGATAGHLQGAAAGAAQHLQGTAGTAAAGLQSAVAASATQLQQPLAEGAVQLQHQAAAAVSQLQQHVVSATSQLLTSNAAAAAAKLQADAAAAVTDLQQRAAATAAEAAWTIGEAKSRVDGKAPGQQRTWQEEVLACSGILSLISPYWWSEETIAGTGAAAGHAGAAPAPAAAAADAEPLLQGAYGSDGSGMDDGGGGGSGGPGHGSSNSGGDGSSGGEDGSSGGSSGGQGSGRGDGSGGGDGGGGGSSGTPWDGFDQFPPSGGFDPVMLVPIALAAATAGLSSLFGSSTSQGTAQARHRSRSSAHPEALKQLKNSSSKDSYSAATASSPQEQRMLHSGHKAAGRPSAAAAAAAVVTAADVQSAAAAGVPLLGPGPVALPHAATVAADGEHWTYEPFLHAHAQDEPVLAWAGPEAAQAGGIICAAVSSAVAAGPDGSLTVGMQQQAAPSPGRRRPASSVPAASGCALLLPFSTSQQISWEELEELPLPAKQEILSLRAVVTANKQQQRALHKQLQQVEQHLAQKEQELASSAAQHIVLQAEAAAALSELQACRGDTAAADSHAAQAAADCSARSGGVSADQLRSTFAAQITHLTKEAAAASCAAALQVAALQAQLDSSQQSAADVVSVLEMRLSKVTASKARMQLQFEDSIAARDAELAESRRQAAQLQASLQEAIEALQETQQQVAAEQAAQLQLQDALAAAADAREQLAQELQDSRHLAAEQQAAAAADSVAAVARIAELQAEVSGLKAGYGPVLLGLEVELATERANAHQLVAALKQRFADAESSIHSQMQRLQQQLHEAEASCAAASTRSDCLQGDLAAMQKKQNTLLAQLEFAKAASAAQVSQLEASMRALEQQLAQTQAAAEEAGASDAAAAASPQQLDGSQARVEQLQAQLEAGRSATRERISSLEQQIDQLKQQQLAEAAAGQQLETLCSTNKQQLDDAYATLEAERAATQQHLETLTAELEGVQSGYSAFVAQLESELAAERSFSRRQVSDVKEQLLAAQAELSALQQQLQQLEADKAALLQANSEQQQAAAEELAAVRAQEEETEQRCRYLEAELAAATAEEAEEVAVLRQTLEKQRGEVATQVTELQARLEQQEQEALAQIHQLQLQIQQHTVRHQQALQQRELESGSALQHALACHTAQLEADLEHTSSSQQHKLSELQGMLTAARRERDQLSAAMLLLSTAVGGAEQDQGAEDPDGAAAMAAAQQAVPLAAAVHQLRADVAHLTAATAASQAESDRLQAQLADAQRQHRQLQEQHAHAQADFAAAQQQLQAALASAEADDADKAGLIAQLRQQLSAQESKLQELTQQAAAAQAAVAVAERRLSEGGSSLTEARVAQLSAAAMGLLEGAELLALDANLGLRHASQGTAGSVSTVSMSAVPQPSPGSCLMPLLEPSANSVTAPAAAPDAATVVALSELAGVSALLAASRQEAAAKAEEVQDLQRSLDVSQGKLAALEAQLQTMQDQHSSETASLRQAVAAATAQASELEQRLAAAVAESHRLQQQLCEMEQQHAATTAALQQELQVCSSEAAQKVAELEASAAQVAAATDRAAAIAAKAAVDAEAHQAELSAAQAALAAAEHEHGSSSSLLQQELADRAAMVQEAVAAAEAAQAALIDSNAQASQLAEALAEAKQSMHQQLEDSSKQHAVVTAQSAARLQALQQQVEAQQALAAAAMSERDQAQQEVAQLQVQLLDAAVVQQEREAALQQRLADAQQGLQYTIGQMEKAAQSFAAVEARRQELSADKAALEAERTQLLQRCQTAEQRGQQQAKQLKALLATVAAAAPQNADTTLAAAATTSASSEAFPDARVATPQDSRRSSATAASSSSAKADLLQHSGELAQLAAHISGLTACCSQRQRQLDDMSAQLAASAAASDMWRAQAESATEQQVRVTAVHQQAQQRLAAKVAELGLLQQQVEAGADKDAALQQQLLQQMAVAAEEQQLLQAQLQRVQQQLAVAATEKADLVAKCASLQAHCSQLTADQAQQEELQEQVQQLEQDLQAKQQTLDQLHQDLSTKAAAEQQLAQQLQELRKALQEQQQQLGAASNERLAVQAQLDDAQAQLQATHANLQERCQQLPAAQTDLAAAQAELAAAKQEAELHTAAAQSLAADKDAAVAVALEQKSGLGRELESVQAENVALAEQVQRLTDAMSAAAAAAAAASEAEAAAKQELQQQLGRKSSVLAAAVVQCEAQQARWILAAAATEEAQGGLAAADKAHTLEAHTAQAAAAALAAATAAGEIASLKRTEAVLEEQFNSTCAERDQLMQKCDVLQAKISMLEPQQERLEAQLAESIAAGEAVTNALQAAQQQLAAVQEEHAAVQQQLQAEHEAHALATAAIKELEERAAELTAASGTAAQVLATLQDQHAALQDQHSAEVTELSRSKQELDVKVAQLDKALQDATAALTISRQELEAAQEQLEGEQAVHAATAHAKKQQERQIAELHDAAAAAAQELEQLQQDLQRKQQQVDAMQTELDDSRNMAADVGMQKQQVEQQATGLEQQLSQAKGDLQTAQQRAQELQAQLLDVQQELAGAHANQAELTEQLLEVSAQKAKLAINLSSRGGARATDESGAWKLRSCHDTPRADLEDELHDALASAHQQLESFEQDVLALEFVAEQGALEDIVDLEMHYSNPHLESIHRTVVELRKQAALSSPRGRPLQVWSANIASSEASSMFTASFGGASTPASSRAVSKAGAPSGAAPHHLAELGAKAEAAASRPLVVSTAVDSSLQAVQAAKESLQSMHDKDMTLKLFSQSVQDVLARKEAGSTRVSESPLRPVTEGGQQGDSAASQAHDSLNTSLRVQSLLAARTKQEVEAIVAEAFDTPDTLDEPLEAMLSRSASRTHAASGGAGTSAGGVSSVGGMSSLSTGSDSTEKLSAEIEGYKRQIADLQQKLDAKAAAAAAAVAAAKLESGTSQETMAKLEAQLVSAQAVALEADAAQQELQQQKAAAEEARKQLLQQVSTLTQEASDLQQLSAQLADAQAANAELSAQSEALQQQLHAAQQQLQERQLEDQALQRHIDRVTALEAELAALQKLQLERQAFQQQLDKIAALEAEVVALQQQLLSTQRPATHDAAVEADLLTPRGKGKGLSTCSSAAVSAVRAATHSLLLHSNPFELDLGPEQTMLPTSNDDGCERHISTLGGEALLSRPLHAKALMSPTSVRRHSLEMDGMAEMLSSDHQDCLNSQPASAELETEYMRYTRPAHMSHTMLDGANRRPALPSSEVDGEPDAAVAAVNQQLCQGTGAPAPAAAAASCSIVEELVDEANRVGLIADSVPASLSTAVGIAGSRRMSAPGLFTADSDEPQRLAQRALRTLQSQKASLKERGSWPGDDRTASTALALASAAQDISRLGVELEGQQAAVRQKLMASQALAEGLKRRAAAADMSTDQVVGDFFKVYNTALFVADDRNRVVEQLIEARVAQQNLSSQLATKAGQIQQLECDRALALKKLWHSEEKLVALEAQLGSFEAQLQERQEGLAAQGAALDVAAMAAGPLAGLSPRQMSDLFAMLDQANSIVQQQRSKVQEALTKWRRSSGGGSSSSSGDGSNVSKRPSSPGVTGLTSSGTAAGAAVTAAMSAGSRAQLAQLQDAQQQLMQELRRSLSPRSTGHRQPTSPDQRLSLVAPAWSSAYKADASSPAAAAAAGCDPGAVVVPAASPQLDAANLPQEVSAYVASLEKRLMSLQGLTQAISAEVMAKHQEVTALQDGFTKIEVTKQLLAQQLQAKSAEAAALEQQLAVLQSELAAVRHAPAAARASATGSGDTTPTGMAPGSRGSSAGGGSPAQPGALLQKKPSLAARIRASFGTRHSTDGTQSATVCDAPVDLQAAERVSDECGAPSNAPQTSLLLGVGLFQVATPSLNGTDDRLATASRAVPGVQELVQHFEEAVALERTPSCTNSTCSLQSDLQREEQAPHNKGRPAGEGEAPGLRASWQRPTPLPRVATLSHNSSAATSPKSTGRAGSRVPVSPKAASAFGRTVPAPLQTHSGSATSRIPGGAASPKSPCMSAGGSGWSTPKKQSASRGAADTGGVDLAAVSSHLRAAATAGSSSKPAAAGTRMPAVSSTLARSGSASSAKSDASGVSAAAAEMAGGSLRQQLSRLVPGTSNGSTGSASERSGGGSKQQGSIFKSKPAGSKTGSAAASGKEHASGAGAARKGR